MRHDLCRTATVQIISQEGSRTLIRYDLRKLRECEAGFAVSDSIGGNDGVFEGTGLHEADPLDRGGPLVHPFAAAMLCDFRMSYILHFPVQHQDGTEVESVQNRKAPGRQVFLNKSIDFFCGGGINHMEIALTVDDQHIKNTAAAVAGGIPDQFALANHIADVIFIFEEIVLVIKAWTIVIDHYTIMDINTVHVLVSIHAPVSTTDISDVTEV